MRVVYLEPDSPTPPPPFRTGAAGHVRMTDAGVLEADERVQLSANTVHALEGHGVLEALNRLPLEMGRSGGGAELMLPQAVLDEAADILTQADRNTYGATWEFVVARVDGAEFRVRVDNREYQRALARLRDLLVSASRQGHAVWLRI